MFGKYTLANNVKSDLAVSLSASAVSIVVNKAVGIYNDPPDPTGDAASDSTGVLSLVDSDINPTQTEIVTYRNVVDNGDGTLTLGGVTRGVDGTAGQAFAAGAIVYQSVTADQMSDDVVTVNRVANTLVAPSMQALQGFTGPLHGVAERSISRATNIQTVTPSQQQVPCDIGAYSVFYIHLEATSPVASWGPVVVLDLPPGYDSGVPRDIVIILTCDHYIGGGIKNAAILFNGNYHLPFASTVGEDSGVVQAFVRYNKPLVFIAHPSSQA